MTSVADTPLFLRFFSFFPFYFFFFGGNQTLLYWTEMQKYVNIIFTKKTRSSRIEIKINDFFFFYFILPFLILYKHYILSLELLLLGYINRPRRFKRVYMTLTALGSLKFVSIVIPFVNVDEKLRMK